MPIEQNAEKFINDGAQHRGADFDARGSQASLFCLKLRFPVRAELTLILRFLGEFAPREYRKTRDAGDRESRREKQHHEPVKKLAGLRTAQGMPDQVR